MRNLLRKYKCGLVALVIWSLIACTAGNNGAVEKVEPTATSDVVEHPESTANPFACPGGYEPRSDDQFAGYDYSGFSPDCSCITSVTRGPSWQGLTIGESTLREVQSVLEAEGIQSPQDNAWQFRDPHEPVIWYVAEACFLEEKLSVLFISIDPETRRMNLDQILEAYGLPDRVTWGLSYDARSLIWSERGLLIFMGVAGLSGGSILLFPPFPSEAVDTSWLMASLPNGPIGTPLPDEEWGSINLTEEDPWEIEQ